MTEDEIRYDRMVESALRSVVRDALTQAAEHGLPGDHHFYITFKTGHPAVRIPGYLKAQYADEMTIVLQYQFIQLQVDDAGFSVTLSFNNKHERLRIPYSAITTFADPSVNFALQFQAMSDEDNAIDAFPPPDSKGETVTAMVTDADKGNETTGQRKQKPAPAIAPDGGASQSTPNGTDSDAPEPTDQSDEPADEASKVVTLDKFRKK